MKAAFITLVISSALLLTAASLHAEGTNATTRTGPPRTEGSREFQLIPARMAEKLNLTDDQKEKIKAIEESFGKSYQEYRTTHKDEIEAARQAMEKAKQDMEKVMAGIQAQRQAAMEQIKALLTDEQKQQIQNQQGRTPESHSEKK